MNVLTCLTYYRPHYSGLTIYAEREAHALAKRGHQVTIITSRYQDYLPAYERLDGIEIIRPKVWFRISKGVIMPSILYWAWKSILKADVVQLHVPQLDAAPIAVISRLLGKPVVLTYHCDLLLPSGFIHLIANNISDLANRITASLSKVIVTNTRDYAENSPFLQRYLSKVHPIFPPIELTHITKADIEDFRDKYKLNPNHPIIGMAARLATEKGVEFLAEALPIILEEFPDARVLFVGPYQNVVGEEDYSAKLKPLLDQLGIHWTFLGVISPIEMTAFFHECDVTVLPSINSTESYGLVQIESMMCGTPVAATDLPGVRVPVRISEMGRIVEPANADALAQSVIEILEKPESYSGQPEGILAKSTPDAVAEAYENLFNALKK